MKKYFNFIRCFLKFLGRQNDYLYPFEGQVNAEALPFKKAHWWKTRIGVGTAMDLAKSIWLHK